jgi:hypothetical protein
MIPSKFDLLTYEDARHLYFYNKQPVIGVSKILELGGLSDFSMVDPEILRKAQQFGKHVHRATELFDRNALNMANLDVALQPYLQAWINFCNEYDVEIIEIERALYSELWQYAGTLDRIIRMTWNRRRILVVCDLKSSTSMTPAYPVQLSGYKVAAQTWLDLKLDGCLGLQLKPDMTSKPVFYNDRKFENIFLSTLVNVRYRLENKLIREDSKHAA